MNDANEAMSFKFFKLIVDNKRNTTMRTLLKQPHQHTTTPSSITNLIIHQLININTKLQNILSFANETIKTEKKN